jgi:hypothetical protein
MTAQRFLVGLTVVNLVLVTISLAQLRPAAAEDNATVLRGRELEIVDDRGRVRASIKIHPANSAAATPYPDTVILRLIDPNGHPNVKLAASEQGAGLGLVGDSDLTHVVLQAQGTSASLVLTNKDGRQQRVAP